MALSVRQFTNNSSFAEALLTSSIRFAFLAAAFFGRFDGVNDSPRSIRFRTSRTVVGEVETVFAISVEFASGRSPRAVAISFRNCDEFVGRCRPSRPTRTIN